MLGSRSRRLAAPAALAAALALAAPAAAHDVTTIATGLNAPRGMDFGPDGALYVAEAGTAGDTCTGEGEARLCVGATGSVTRVEPDGSGQSTAQAGLPSLSFMGEPVGPHDVSFRGGDGGYVLVGLGADPARRAGLGDVGAALGKLYKWTPGSAPTAFADLAAFEATDPDGEGPDSNPWSVESAGGEIVATDAGGNSVVSVDRDDGGVALEALLPFGEAPGPGGAIIPYQPVPTGIVRADDGSYRVGQLTGVPFPEGAAKVFRLFEGDLAAWSTGYTHVIDVAIGADRTLYVLKIFRSSLLSGPSEGLLVAVKPDGSRTFIAEGRLDAPAGLTVRGDHLYVSNKGLTPGGGEVLKISTQGW